MVTLFANPNDIKHWNNAALGKPVDWDTLFNGYKAVVDFPGSLYYKDLLKKYPDAKIILSVRDADSWYNSTYSTIYAFKPSKIAKLKLIFAAPFSKKANNILRIIKMIKFTLWEKLFQGKFEDSAFAKEIYNLHIEDTIKTVPADQLLIFKAEEGWEPLCKFLNKPIPTEPYPRTNSKENFHQMTKPFVSI